MIGIVKLERFMTLRAGKPRLLEALKGYMHPSRNIDLRI
jgi:hypothetical protein